MAQGTQRTIFFINSGQRSQLGQLTVAANIENGRGMPATPYRIYGSYAIVYITSGRGSYRDANGFAQEIHAGDLIVVFPELPHSYGPDPGRTWGELYIVFNGPAIDAWRAMGLLSSRQPVYRLLPVDRWEARIREVIGSRLATTPQDQCLHVCKLLTLLTQIAATQAAEAPAPERSHWLARACQILGKT